MTQPHGEDPVIKYSDDQSLQTFGRNLGTIENAVDQVRATTSAVEAQQERLRMQLEKIHAQAENDLPASNRLRAEIEEVTTMARRARTADDWSRVAAAAATLPGTYKAEHDTDDARAAGERAPLHMEQRADAGYAAGDG